MAKRKLFFGIISFVALLSVVVSNLYVFGPTANAGVDDAYGTGNGTVIRDYEAAKKYINDLCGNGGYRGSVALAMYPSEVSFNDATGEMKYKANLVWRSCSDKGQDGSRAFAVTGYPSTTGGQPATCPDAGTYAVAHTYDCVKYTDSDLGHLKGYATLGCDAGSGYDCVTGGSSDSGLFKSSIEVNAKEPTYDSNNPNVRGVNGLDGQVPDWATRTLKSDSWSFYRSSAFCTYYKANNNGASNYTPQGNCIDLTINVSWTRFNYNLTPSITNMDATKDTPIDSASGPYTVKGSVYNDGPTDSRPNTEWQLTKVVYKPSVAVPKPSGGDTSTDPCRYFSGRSCSTASAGDVTAYRMDGGTGATYTQKKSEPYDRTDTITDYDVGTHICYAMSVKPYNHTTSDWRHSQLYCLVVSKSPKVQVLGGDLVVGRGSAFNTAPVSGSEVKTSISTTTSDGYFGSWSEYGILATGTVKGMASGSGYVGGSPTSDLCSETPRKLSILTFTNKPAVGACGVDSIGKYSNTSVAPNIAERFPVTSSTDKLLPIPPSDTVDLMRSTPAVSGLYTSVAADLKINSSKPIPAGRSIIINAPNTTITITGNIQYTTDPLTSISQIPQVVIIAKNIIIADSVSQIDSWLVAVGSGATDGRINTCGAGGIGESDALKSTVCATKLTVNGPISTNHLILRRTAGSGTGTDAGDPAEVFNLRADAYIWAASYAPGTGRLPTVTTTEIPPRF